MAWWPPRKALHQWMNFQILSGLLLHIIAIIATYNYCCYCVYCVCVCIIYIYIFVWIVKTLWQVFCSMLTQNRLYIRHAGRQEGQIVQWGVIFPTGCSNSNGVLTIKQLLRYMD